MALVIAGVTMQSGCVPPEIGIVNGRSLPKVCKTRREGQVRKRAVKSAERKSYATHVERDETDRQAVIGNTDNGERAQLAQDVRDTAGEMQVGRGARDVEAGNEE